MHYYKINNEIMQYSTFGNDIALIMHYRALFTMSDQHVWGKKVGKPDLPKIL